jgi:GDP-L-fucose synthase
MTKSSRIFVAGHRGLVGSAIVKHLKACGFGNLILRAKTDADLTERAVVDHLFATERPEFVFLAAAKVGGILAHTKSPAEFIRDNLAIELNVIDAAYRFGVKKLQFLGSACIYPRITPQPIKEEYLLTGILEATNEAYAVAKIAGIQLCQAYRKQYGLSAVSLMPTNLYGPGDNFDLNSSHVLPALIRKFYDAQKEGRGEVVVWGSGNARREFLHADDLASAALFLMDHYDEPEIVNVGTGEDIAICDLASLIARIIGFRGKIVFDSSKPDGTPKRRLDVSRLHALGWRHEITLSEGIRATYDWFAHCCDSEGVHWDRPVLIG